MGCSDKVLYPQLVKLVGCISEQIEKCEIDLCYLGIQSGQIADLTAVMGDGTMAWVRLSTITPISDTQRCAISLQAQVEVGFATCYPIDESGEAHTSQEDFALADKCMALQGALLRAVACCDWADSRRAVTIVNFQPLGPQGGVVGGTWLTTLDY
jgi:hypothetical protein